MSDNVIKICNFCLNNSLQEGIKFTKKEGRDISKFYMVDDCCDNCIFIREKQYEEDKLIKLKKKKRYGNV